MKKLLVDNIDVKYDNEEKYILKDFSLEVEEKELLVILGNSGCGKSTLLKAISGLIKPKKGKIEYNDISCFNARKKHNIPVEKRNIGYCFQNYALCPHMDVYNNLALPLKARKMKKYCIKAKVQEMLDFIDMHILSEKLPNSLSGGEKQRVALGRALIYDPTLLLLDEPLANLDATLKAELINKIRNTHDELGITSIYVTHDQLEAFAIADRIAVMKDGKIIQIDTPEKIYRNPKSLFVAQFVGKNNTIIIDDFIRTIIENTLEYKYILFRPENVRIVKESNFKAEVISIKYLGVNYEITLEYNNQIITLYSDAKDNIEFKKVVNIQIDKYMLFK